MWTANSPSQGGRASVGPICAPGQLGAPRRRQPGRKSRWAWACLAGNSADLIGGHMKSGMEEVPRAPQNFEKS